MSSAPNKRKAISGGASLLQRRVRPRVEPEPESDVAEDSDADSQALSKEGIDSYDSESDGDDDAESGSESGSEEESEEEELSGSKIDASQLSFGALARAQAAMGAAASRKGQAGSAAGSNEAGDGKEEEESSYRPPSAAERAEQKKKQQLLRHRASKHAPAEMTSKKAVSRRRDFVAMPNVQARDPRFLPLAASNSIGKIDNAKLRKAYSFLDDYVEDEMKQLRAAIKKLGSKDPEAKEKLQRALLSIESKKKAQVRKDRERAVIEEHRLKEKELVKDGKQPFYLKKTEQKKRVLVDQFAGLKKGQVDKAIERRRKKVAGKEKKLLPYARRTAE
ncbi:hypothetical protein B0T26DRAFT_747710 [Lasiosphaeria miniovina]|uniref:rRNA biogenesis protein RRP36 n=1 Tax=Lasiosphaeria miniovina TaxID=1954250 RepID=A0AA40B4E4_9PEZI|nr:uncharacterized protein B0T26DRAFT_747710 [Lasiosphaeria miniovina]KAK0727374.1 hypothetical protein B0T26DRAFT_747710 [Lasiosphaeria miniovina]